MAKPFDRRALAVSGASSHGSWAPSRRAGRTAVLGGHVEQCDDCGATRIAYNSCRNRHCPECQGLARAKWLADRQAELLPVPYFHVVFTLPAPLGEIAFQNKAAVYAILFRAAAKTLAIIAADSRHACTGTARPINRSNLECRPFLPRRLTQLRRIALDHQSRAQTTCFPLARRNPGSTSSANKPLPLSP